MNRARTPMRRAAIACGVALLAGCSPDHERFDDGPAVAKVLRGAGIPCEYVPSEQLTGFPLQVPEGESWGQCGGIAIYVLGDKDALAWLQDVRTDATDDIPRVYWVYGENWFVASQNESTRDRLAEALGGDTTDNTKI